MNVNPRRLVSPVAPLSSKGSAATPMMLDRTLMDQDQPGGLGGSSGGQREFAPVLARAALAVGVSSLFIETHQDPDRAPSDGPNMIPIAEMHGVLARLKAFDTLAKQG